MIAGSDNIFAIENFYVKYFRESGVDVKVFPSQTIFDDYYKSSLLNKLLFKTGISSHYKNINAKFKRAVVELKPEIIWVFKGMELLPSSLIWAKKQGIKLVNYNPDNPFLFSGKGSGNKNVTDSIPLYDLHLTYCTLIKNEVEKKYHLPAEYLPFGFEVEDEVFKLCKAEVEIIRPAFVGNPDGDRAAFIEQLARQSILIDVYGIGWNKYLSHPNISTFEKVSEIDFWKTLRKYRVQLNLMRPHNPNSHNMRSFEIPGIGGIMLAPDTPDHQNYFVPDKEIFLFGDLNTCVQKINYLLGLNANDANTIRENARKKSLEGGYTYKDRSKQALTAIQNLLG